jgi:lysophospholipase L1-like esterase
MAASRKIRKGGNAKLDWVSCDGCGRWELFDNCKDELGLDGFDVERISKVTLSCRMCKVECRIDKLEVVVKEVKDRVESVSDRLGKLELSNRTTESVSKLECRIKELSEEEECKVAEVNTRVDEVEHKLGEVASQIVVGEIRIEDELRRIVNITSDAESRVTAVELRMSEMAQEWPTPAESKKVEQQNKQTSEPRDKKVRFVSFSEKFKDKPKDTVLVLGDSMVRGMGSCLERDSGGEGGMYRKLSYGGARIEDIDSKLGVIGDKPESHVVIVVGTNNLKKDGTELIMARFRSLISELRKYRYRKVSFVGILRRTDVSSYIDSKRLSLNLRLQRLCVENEYGYVERDLVSEHLDRDGLHLNAEGQDVVARTIFRHCKQFLN